MGLTRWEWIFHKHEMVYKAIRACWDESDQRLRTWDENRITGDVLRAIGTSGTASWSGNICQASWQVFQAYGDYETENGDIALKVVLSTLQGDVLEGVKHFEAKAADPNTGEYAAIRKGQFNRVAGSVGHEVLLYTLWKDFGDGPFFRGAGSLPTPLAAGLVPGGHIALNANAFSFVRVLAEALCGRGLETDQQRIASFQAELNKVDSRYTDTSPLNDSFQRPTFFMEAHIAVGEGLVPRQNFEPPGAYAPLPDVASDYDRPSNYPGPAGF